MGFGGGWRGRGQRLGQLPSQALSVPPGLFASVSKISKAVDAPPSSVTSTPRTPRMDFSRVTGKGRREHKGQRGEPVLRLFRGEPSFSDADSPRAQTPILEDDLGVSDFCDAVSPLSQYWPYPDLERTWMFPAPMT